MPENVHTTIQLCSFHMLAKSFKLGFSITWTENAHIYKLGFEDTEEREIKLPTLIGSWRRQGNSRKTSTSASLTTLKPLTVFSSVQFSHSVVSDSLRLHELQHAKPPCPSPTLGAYIKRLFSSSSLSAIRVVSSAYLRLLIFLPAILIPACASSSPAFLMMYSA